LHEEALRCKSNKINALAADQRPYVKDVILRYLECGDLYGGFARIKCPDCGQERLLAFSCNAPPLLPVMPSKTGG
jgi:hypothetical protein